LQLDAERKKMETTMRPARETFATGGLFSKQGKLLQDTPGARARMSIPRI
jgi:hypothetical protein